MSIKLAVGSAVGGVTALVVLWGSWYTVDKGDRGVILRNGALIGVAEPGLGFKVPMIDSVKDIDIRSKAKLYEVLWHTAVTSKPQV